MIELLQTVLVTPTVKMDARVAMQGFIGAQNVMAAQGWVGFTDIKANGIHRFCGGQQFPADPHHLKVLACAIE
jgi:hypothetical protein